MKVNEEVSISMDIKKLACQGCRKRRRKCDLKQPCSNCQKFNVDCIPVNQDLRKKRYSSNYVKSLENHISMLETSIQNLKNLKHTSEKDRDQNIQVSDNLNLIKCSRNESLFNNVMDEDANTIHLPKITPIVSGSIYSNDSLAIENRNISPEGLKYVEFPLGNLNNLSRSPLILRALSLFFKWLYPGHYTFIHRETFLSAFFGDSSTKSYYYSEELVFAISSLGARLSNKSDDLYKKSQEYYTISKTKILNKIFQLDGNQISVSSRSSSSKLAIVQTLLCLAFYDIGNGENPLAWYESGLAFRIAHEIGLHLNPETWDDVYADELSKVDIEVRSRIYWGCYLADHLISVLFGRSNTLRLSNSTIPETDELPNIETGIEDYQYEPKIILSMANPLKKLIVMSRITEIFASKIFIQAASSSERTEYLSKFNLEIYNWRMDLPGEFKWSKASIKEFDYNPTLTHIWYHYYIILLSYNKPFIDDLEQSKLVIHESIEELYWLLISFKKKFGTFEKSNIYMIYSTILSIQCLKSNSIDKKYLTEFMNFLGSPTLNYKLGKKFVDSEMNTDISFDLLSILTNNNDFAFEYNFDFTLLNEIDTLIGGSNENHNSSI